jgi:hypothetical protein
LRIAVVLAAALVVVPGCAGRLWSLRAEVADPARVTILDAGTGLPAVVDDPASGLVRRPDGSVWYAPPGAPPRVVLHAGQRIESVPRRRGYELAKIPERLRFSITEAAETGRAFDVAVRGDDVRSLEEVGRRRGTWRYLVPGLVVAVGCGAWLALVDESVTARAVSGACLAGGLAWAGSGAWNMGLEPEVARPITR